MMKFGLFPVILLFVHAGLSAQNVSLDQAVQTSAQTIETRLPKGAKTAILTFTSTKQDFSDYIIDEIATALSASRNIQVIDRQHTDAIRKEFNIQFSGDVSDAEVKRIGQQLGAQYVVTGSLVDVGNAYRFRLTAINIETAVREGSSSLNININDPQVVFLITGQRPSQASVTQVINISYKIGDTGPAGGIVFYDRGFTGDGWRYLEAAPPNTEFSAEWGAYKNNVPNTSSELGSGKQNTKLIVDQLLSLGETNKTAQISVSMDVNGYRDWFLPSKDELSLMYTILKKKGLGGFSNNWYWSSTHYNNENAWGQGFSDGRQDYDGKYRSYLVRAVRAF